MVEESPLIREMYENGGQIGFPENKTILVFVQEKNQWFLCEKTMFDFFIDGDMMNHDPQGDENILFNNYVAEQWDIFRK